MVNQSKSHDPRFWAKWKNSGAVETIEDAIARQLGAVVQDRTYDGQTSSQQLRKLEYATQKADQRNPIWLLAGRLDSVEGAYVVGDSRPELEALGFTVIGVEKDNLLYTVNPPKDWTKETHGPWTTIKDENGKSRVSSFYKSVQGDNDAFLDIESHDKRSAQISAFVNGLKDEVRVITTAYVHIPNTPNCQPEVMRLHLQYGDRFGGVTDQVEVLRTELGCTYDVLQKELQRRLPR